MLLERLIERIQSKYTLFTIRELKQVAMFSRLQFSSDRGGSRTSPSAGTVACHKPRREGSPQEIGTGELYGGLIAQQPAGKEHACRLV